MGEVLPDLSRLDRIELRGLRVMGTHGVLAEERVRAQPFAVDVDAYLAEPATASDHIEYTVDYAQIVRVVDLGISQGPSYSLLESLADSLAGNLLDLDEKLIAVSVTIRKVRPPVPAQLDTAGVRVTRHRANANPGADG